MGSSFSQIEESTDIRYNRDQHFSTFNPVNNKPALKGKLDSMAFLITLITSTLSLFTAIMLQSVTAEANCSVAFEANARGALATPDRHIRPLSRTQILQEFDRLTELFLKTGLPDRSQLKSPLFEDQTLRLIERLEHSRRWNISRLKDVVVPHSIWFPDGKRIAGPIGLEVALEKLIKHGRDRIVLGIVTYDWYVRFSDTATEWIDLINGFDLKEERLISPAALWSNQIERFGKLRSNFTNQLQAIGGVQMGTGLPNGHSQPLDVPAEVLMNRIEFAHYWFLGLRHVLIQRIPASFDGNKIRSIHAAFNHDLYFHPLQSYRSAPLSLFQARRDYLKQLSPAEREEFLFLAFFWDHEASFLLPQSAVRELIELAVKEKDVPQSWQALSVEEAVARYDQLTRQLHDIHTSLAAPTLLHRERNLNSELNSR